MDVLFKIAIAHFLVLPVSLVKVLSAKTENVVNEGRPLVPEVVSLAAVLPQVPGVVERELVLPVSELGLVGIQESDVVVADKLDEV